MNSRDVRLPTKRNACATRCIACGDRPAARFGVRPTMARVRSLGSNLRNVGAGTSQTTPSALARCLTRRRLRIAPGARFTVPKRSGRGRAVAGSRRIVGRQVGAATGVRVAPRFFRIDQGALSTRAQRAVRTVSGCTGCCSRLSSCGAPLTVCVGRTSVLQRFQLRLFAQRVHPGQESHLQCTTVEREADGPVTLAA